MPLTELALNVSDAPLPPAARALITDATHRIDAFEAATRAAMPAFVPSDFELCCRALSAIHSANLATGRRFLEWGSGVGVVTCLAAQLGFDAIGIEIELPLVEIADELASVHEMDAQFIAGSFVPEGTHITVGTADDFNWLTTTGEPAYDELGLDIDDFDIIFAYPWPGEEQTIFDLFDDHAATGALLLTYHGLEGVRLHRKGRS